jgi:hypothetical protein
MAEQADNPALTPLLRLCGDCLAQRVRLLEMPEFAANADSVCRVDGEPLFKTSGGFALSRTNHWENLISGVTTPSQLLSKLLPEHRYDHPKHQELRDQFEAWLTEFKLQMSIAMAKRPRGARELKDAMAERIAAKRVELGLQED